MRSTSRQCLGGADAIAVRAASKAAAAILITSEVPYSIWPQSVSANAHGFLIACIQNAEGRANETDGQRGDIHVGNLAHGEHDTSAPENRKRPRSPRSTDPANAIPGACCAIDSTGRCAHFSWENSQ